MENYGNSFLFSCLTYQRPIPRFGRENFQEAMKIAHRVESNEIDWSQFKYMVFDQPNVDSSYSERYSSLRKYLHKQGLTQQLTNFSSNQ